MESIAAEEPLNQGSPESEPAAAPTVETDEWEFVLGSRQFGSLLFVAVVVVVACSAGAYLVGKAASPKPAATLTVIAPVPSPLPILEATIAQESAPVQTPPKTAPALEPPLFSEPAKGSSTMNAEP